MYCLEGNLGAAKMCVDGLNITLHLVNTSELNVRYFQKE